MSLPRSAFSQLVDTTGDRATYVCVIKDFVPVASPTDFITLVNPAASGKVIRVVAVRLTADATATGGYDFYCYKRTAVNTGGTAAVIATTVPMDTFSPIPAGVVSTYSVNPTGLGAGNLLRGEQYALPAITTTGYPFNPVVWFNEAQNSQPPMLRSGELMSISGNGNAYPAGMNVYITFIWSEDTI